MNIYKYILRLFLFLLLNALTVNSNAELNTNPGPVYKFGVTPWQQGRTVDSIRRLYKPMLDWLGEKVGATFVIVGARNYNQMIELLANESIHFGSISPIPYVIAKNLNPDVEMLVTELSWDLMGAKKSSTYDNLIVARKDNNEILSIDTLKNKKFGFVSKQSSSGFIYPYAYFNQVDIDYKTYFKQIYFLGSHSRLTDAIAAGSIDAGATWDYNLKQAIAKHGDIFKIIKVVAKIPNLGIAANSSVPEEMKIKVTNALLEIDTALLIGMPAGGYIKKDEIFYDDAKRVYQDSIEMERNK